MTHKELFNQIKSKQSYLCVGLDTDIKLIPKHLLSSADPVFEFNKQIIDATIDYTVAYKPNLAFYESLGASGWESLAKTIEYLPAEVLSIADAKRGDIGNTSNHYARAFFDNLNFDAITLSPYMGHDAIAPYLEYKDKWAILLALTSNPSSSDFEQLMLQNREEKTSIKLYEQVIRVSKGWPHSERLMYVVGATQAAELAKIRGLIPNHFLLVPGVGAQGGSLKDVSRNGMNSTCGLLVNSSRGIIYASDKKDFAGAAKIKAAALQAEMKEYLASYCK